MMEKCEKCGQEYSLGEWPWCPHGIPGGMLGQYPERWDEHVAPPPSDMFHPRGLPEYDKNKGYRITSLADHKRLMRLNKTDYAGKKVGMPGSEF